MIKEIIEECIEKYYLDEEMYYSEDREDEKGDDISIKDELTEILTAKQVPFQISKVIHRAMRTVFSLLHLLTRMEDCACQRFALKLGN